MASRLDSVVHRGFEPRKKNPIEKPIKQKEPLDEYTSIPLSLIDTDSNIRTEYDDEGIQNLADSMLQYGQLEAVKVYEKGDKYIIIFGHRRFLAAQKAKLKELKCVVVDKPDDLDKIYLQAIENEHSVNLSSTDREKYVKILKDKHKQTVPEIAKKLGKSVSWVYKALNAFEFREIHSDILDKSGITLTTRDTMGLANFTKEEISAAVELITKNPGQKTNILDDLKKKKIKNKGSSSSKTENESLNGNKNKIDYNLENKDNIEYDRIDDDPSSELSEKKLDNSSVLKTIQIIINIAKDDDNKKFKILYTSKGDLSDENLKPRAIDFFKSYFEKGGYSFQE